MLYNNHSGKQKKDSDSLRLVTLFTIIFYIIKLYNYKDYSLIVITHNKYLSNTVRKTFTNLHRTPLGLFFSSSHVVIKE